MQYKTEGKTELVLIFLDYTTVPGITFSPWGLDLHHHHHTHPGLYQDMGGHGCGCQASPSPGTW